MAERPNRTLAAIEVQADPAYQPNYCEHRGCQRELERGRRLCPAHERERRR